MTIPTPPESPLTEMTTPGLPPPPVAMQEMPGAPTRPASVVVIAILFFVGAAFELGSIPTALSGSFAAYNTIDTIVFALVMLYVGVGLLQMQRWARVAALWTLLARFVTSIFGFYVIMGGNYPLPEGSSIPPNLFGITMVVSFILLALYYATLAFFLCRPAVKEAFARR